MIYNNKSLTSTQKIKLLLDEKGITQKKLCDEIGVSENGLKKMFDSNKYKTDTLKKIAKVLGVESSYLLSPIANVTNDAAEIYKRARPYYDIDASASNVEIFNDKPEIPSDYFVIRGFEDCEMWINNWGDSMYPTYKNGQAIGLKRINDLEIIQYGEPYLVITKEQRFVKRLLRSDKKEYLVASSDNESLNVDGKRKYDSFEFSKNKILKLFLIKGSVNRSQI